MFSSGDDNKILHYDFKNRKCNLAAFIDTSDKAIKLKYGASSITHFPDNKCSRALAFNKAHNHLAVA